MEDQIRLEYSSLRTNSPADWQSTDAALTYGHGSRPTGTLYMFRRSELELFFRLSFTAPKRNSHNATREPKASSVLEYGKSAEIHEGSHGCVRRAQMLKYTTTPHLWRTIPPRLTLPFVLLFRHHPTPVSGAPCTLRYPPG